MMIEDIPDALYDVMFELSDNLESDYPYISGTIIVHAKNIFEALEKASDKLKTFGYAHTRLHGALLKDETRK